MHGKGAVIAHANGKGSGEPAHPHSLARTYAVRWSKRYAKGEKLQSKELDMWPHYITKTRLLKYIEIFITKNLKVFR